MTDEVNQLPVVGVVMTGWITPRRHAGQTYAVLDDRKRFPIGEILRPGPAHVGRLRVKIATDLCLSAPIVAMTGRAVIGPARACFRENIARQRNRISRPTH